MMKLFMKENLKNKKGITLIALVITIIVLLILAAVTIATLTGENGLLGKAQQAKEQTTIGEYKEKIDLVRAEVAAESKTEPVTLEKLKTALSDSKQSSWVNKVEDAENNVAGIKLTTNDGYVFLVTTTETTYIGQGDVEIPETISSSDVTISPAFSWKYTNTTTNQEVTVNINNVKDALDFLYEH